MERPIEQSGAFPGQRPEDIRGSRRDALRWMVAGAMSTGLPGVLGAREPQRKQRGTPGERIDELTPEQQEVVDRFEPLAQSVRDEGSMTLEHHFENMGQNHLGPCIVPPSSYVGRTHTVSNDISGSRRPLEVLQVCPNDFCDQYHLSTKAGLFRQNRNDQWELVEPGEDYEVSLVQSDTGNTMVYYEIKQGMGNFRLIAQTNYLRGMYDTRDPRVEPAITNGFPGIDALLNSTCNVNGTCGVRARGCVSLAQQNRLPFQVITLEGACGRAGDLERFGNRHFINGLRNAQGSIVFLDGRGDFPHRGIQDDFVVCNVGNMGYVEQVPYTRRADGANEGIYSGPLSDFGRSVHTHAAATLTEAEAALADAIIQLRNQQAYRGQFDAARR